MRASYTVGEAWCVVRGDRLVVLDRGLDAAGAAAIFDARPSAARLRDDPLALAVLEPVDDGWLLWRRRGVPAATEEPLPDRVGEAWGSDLLPLGSTVAFGAIAALGDALPVEGGVVLASAVRIELVAAAEHAAAGVDAEPEAVVGPGSVVEPEQVGEPESVLGSESVGEPEQVGEADAIGAPQPAHEPEPVGEPEPVAEPEPVEEPEPVVEHAPIAPASPPAEAAPSEPVVAHAPPSDPAADPVPAVTFEPAPSSHPHPEPQPDPEPPAASASVVGIIDSVPGFIRPAAVVEVPDLAVGDHDGMTIAGDAVRALAESARVETPDVEHPSPALGPATGPVVLSSLCAAGHVNPPGATACACGEPIVHGSSDQRARPEFAEVVLPDGERVPLGRGVVLGRRPSSRRVEHGRVPRLVTVHSPSEDISRSHLELRCEDWNVLAVDLDSTNGTVLLRDGAAPMRLRADAPQLVAFGDRLDLGDGVVVRVERAAEQGAR